MNNKFLKNSLSLFTGTMSGQLLIIISSPFLTRIYTLEQFAQLAIFTSILSIFINALSFRYEMAFIKIEEKKPRLALLKIIFIFIIVTSSIIVLFIIILEEFEFIKYFNDSLIYILLWISLIGIGMYNALHHFAIAESNIKKIAISKFQQASSLVLVQITSGILVLKNGLILGDSVSRISGIIIFLKKITKQEYKYIINAPKEDFTMLLIRYKDYAKFSVISGVSNNFVMQSLPLILAIFYAQPLIGLLTIIQRVLVVPIKLVSQSVRQSLLNNMMQNINRKEYGTLQKKIKKVVIVLTLISVIPAIIGIISGEEILVFVLGENLIGSGEIIGILIILSVFQFIFIPVNQTLEFIDEQKVQFKWQIFRFTVILIALFIVPYFGFSFNIVLSVYVAIMCTFYLILFFLTLVILNRKSIQERSK